MPTSGELVARAVTADEMKEIENRGVTFGISKLVMMENAGHSLAAEAMNVLFGKSRTKMTKHPKILLVAGTGNNGGDVFVAARHLLFWMPNGIDLFLVGREADVKTEEALVNLRALRNVKPKVPFHAIYTQSRVNYLMKELKSADLIIVGIFGTGFRGEPRSIQRAVIDVINQNTNSFVMSVDLPSGMGADTGDFEIAVLSDVTVTMHAPKVGMLATQRSKKVCGKIVVANIGLPR